MGRIRSLDSLRGIAALIVVFYHFALVVPGVYPALQSVWPLRALIAGQTAVLVFFVLSGLVLYLSLQRHDRDSYSTFATRRLIRLYPPVVVAVLLSAALYFLVGPGQLPGMEGWLTRYSWNEPPNIGLIAGHLLLLDTDRFHTLNNPMWSLVVEVRLSLLFPLVAAGIRRRPLATVIACLIISWLSRHILSSGHEIELIDPFFTIQFLDLFAIGGLMARYASEVSDLLRRIPGLLVAIVVLVALCMHGRFAEYFMYCSAILMVAVSVTYPLLSRFYGLAPLVWLGERSFSLYLVHVPLLLAAVYKLHTLLPIYVILLGALPLCLVGAEIFWLTVERPSMRLGRRLSRRRVASMPPVGPQP